jgi:hypothetical protein
MQLCYLNTKAADKRMKTNRRCNPTLLIDIEKRQVLWDFQTETNFANPWARQHFVCKIEGRSIMILLKRNGICSRVLSL